MVKKIGDIGTLVINLITFAANIYALISNQKKISAN